MLTCKSLLGLWTFLMVAKKKFSTPLSLLGHEYQRRKKNTKHVKGNFKTNQFLEQKELTFDVSDFLWYMTSIDIPDISLWNNSTLRVSTMGHTLRAYVSGRAVGYKFSQWGGNFTHEKYASLKEGPNIITLLSATIGLANYGTKFNKKKNWYSRWPCSINWKQ